MSEKQRFLTIKEAAEFLQVSEMSLRRWTNSGKLRCFRVGGRSERRFLKEDLLAFMPSREVDLDARAREQVLLPNHLEEKEESERHISLFFRDAEEQWQLLRSYVVVYLQVGDPVMYLQHLTSSEQLIQRLRDEGLPLDKLIARGLLRILPPSQTYLLPGHFDGQKMLDFIEMTIAAALEAGHRRILMTGEMTWSLHGPPVAQEMADYEERINPLVDRYPAVMIVCQYDLKRFAGDVILDALLTHPSILVTNGIATGFHGLQ
jgi:transcriptional repressor of dcmA and dcmR